MLLRIPIVSLRGTHLQSSWDPVPLPVCMMRVEPSDDEMDLTTFNPVIENSQNNNSENELTAAGPSGASTQRSETMAPDSGTDAEANTTKKRTRKLTAANPKKTKSIQLIKKALDTLYLAEGFFEVAKAFNLMKSQWDKYFGGIPMIPELINRDTSSTALASKATGQSNVVIKPRAIFVRTRSISGTPRLRRPSTIHYLLCTLWRRMAILRYTQSHSLLAHKQTICQRCSPMKHELNLNRMGLDSFKEI